MLGAVATLLLAGTVVFANGSINKKSDCCKPGAACCYQGSPCCAK